MWSVGLEITVSKWADFFGWRKYESEIYDFGLTFLVVPYLTQFSLHAYFHIL